MRHKEQGGTMTGVFIGLVLGISFAALLVWAVNQIPVPFTEKEEVARINTSETPMNLPGKPGDTPNAADKAKATVDAPTVAPVTPPPAPLPEVTPAPPEKRHYVQAGSFSSPEEADNLKATLAMQGVEASVRQVILQDKTFYRLIVGPYEKAEDARKSRAELARLGVETILIDQE
ncbi:MAG: SPOR domain-containing protein [Zoogloeaceae bacterium]|jgi:cell division protein FtsN|nr:SPOR domain-containing protein [Zoogloeaceae bacterium]